jgi:glyoxylase-like metal-dependent hydrolase (beta-lactamase superfamily II)
VHTHAAEVPQARGGPPHRTERSVLLYLWRPAALTTLWTLLLGGGRRMEPIAEVVEVADGSRLDDPGRPRVVHVPAHTLGSVGYLLEEREAFCSGDALVTLNLLTGRVGHEVDGEAGHELERLVQQRGVGDLAAQPRHHAPEPRRRSFSA